MDIYLSTTPEVFQSILQKKGFTITWKRNHFSAMQYVKNGRYHLLYLLLDGKTFCDFHFDNTLHGIGIGADYGKKPEAYFENSLKNDIVEHAIVYETFPVTWFTRKNKAIITGFRV